MNETYFLAIDIGASSGRHILGHLEDGKLVMEEIYRFKNGLNKKDGHLLWDGKSLFTQILAGLSLAGSLGKAPAYIGIDTWGVDYALLDAQDQLIGDLYGYRDSRTEASIPAVEAKISLAELYERTGIQFQPFNTIFQLYEDQRSGRLAKAKSMLMLPDYFNFLLTGVKAQEYTNATTTGLLNGNTHCFDSAILERLGIPASIFAPLTQPGTLIGSLLPSIASEVGYQAQVVLPCTHDTASAVMALPSFEAAPYISSGTWSLLGVETPLFHNDAISQSHNFTNEGTPHQGFRYQKNIMGLWMIQQLREQSAHHEDFGQLAHLAAASPVPYLVDVNDPRFLAPGDMGEEINKAVGRKLSLAEAANCVFNSLAFSYAESLKELEKKMGRRYPCLHIIGGGSKNQFLNHLTALRCGKRVIAGPTECTAIGNLLVQMLGVGLIPSEVEAKKIVISSCHIEEAGI